MLLEDADLEGILKSIEREKTLKPFVVGIETILMIAMIAATYTCFEDHIWWLAVLYIIVFVVNLVVWHFFFPT